MESKDQAVCIVDMDGTLLRNDFFVESVAIQLLRNPFKVFQILLNKNGLLQLKFSLLKKREINYPLDNLLNASVVSFLKDKRAEYSKIHVVTASPEEFAKQLLAPYNSFIDEVTGSVNSNLKGAKKLAFIKSTYSQPFDYLGDSKADNIIFAAARQGYLVKGGKVNKCKA